MWIRMAFTIRNITVLLLICSSNGSGTTTTTRSRGALMFSTTRFPSFIRSTTTYTPYTTTSTSVSASATTTATTTNATVTATATVTPMRDVAHEQVSPNTTRSISVGEDLEDNSISQGIIAGVVVGTTLVAAAIITSILLIRRHRYRRQNETSADSLTEVTTTDHQASGIDNVTMTTLDNNNSQRSQNDNDPDKQSKRNDLNSPPVTPTGHAGLVEPVNNSSEYHVHINPLTANTSVDYINPLTDNTPIDNINPPQHNPSADFNPPPNIRKQHLEQVQSSAKTGDDDDDDDDAEDGYVDDNPYFDHHVHQNDDDKQQQHNHPDLQTDAMTYIDMNSPSPTGEGVDFGMIYEYMEKEETEHQSDPLEEYENFKPYRPDLNEESSSVHQDPKTPESIICERVSQEYEDLNPYRPDQDNSANDEPISVGEDPYFDHHVHQHGGQNDDDKHQQQHDPDLQNAAMTYMDMNSPSSIEEGVDFGMEYEYMENEDNQPDPLEEYENFKPRRPDLDEESLSASQDPKTLESIFCERVSQEYEDFNPYRLGQDHSPPESLSVCEEPETLESIICERVSQEYEDFNPDLHAQEGNEQYERLSSANEYSNIRINLSSDIYENVEYQNSDYSNVDSFA